MTKKIIIIIFLTLFVFSCGKKSNPEYKSKRNINHIFKIS